jgi:lipopolysaccharide transport system ATP-binding protein
MSDTVIKAEGLGKKYLIGHQSERERYTALRDVMARNVKGVWNKTRQVLSGQQLLAGDEIEEFWALRDIDFEIKRGDRVGIIGRNGAGKSTLLKVLSRITEPSEGKVTIKGRVASLLEVGTGFHPELTGRENIYLNGAILGMTRNEIKKKFDEIVDFAGVEKFLDTPVKRYSSGMYVRLAFAVAAHLEPEILVVDEVLAVGDSEFQKKCLGKMEDVSKNEGRTVLFVSHNMSAIKHLCNSGILLNSGKIGCVDNIMKVIEKYNSTVFNQSFKYQNTVEKYNVLDICTLQNDIVTNSIDSNQEVVFIIRFEIKDERKISFELSLKDENYNPIIFYPFGIGQNQNFYCKPGRYKLKFKIKFPPLSIGRYYFDLFIVETFVKRLATFINIYSLDVVSSYVVSTGWAFNKTVDIGSIMQSADDFELINME